MKSPYAMLEISEESGDTEIKKAYLTKVRAYPPERFPDEFQKIRQAYELIRTHDDRLSYALFFRRLPEPVEIAELILRGKSVQAVPTRTEFQQTLEQDIQSFCANLKI